MGDEDKTKGNLILELAELRQRLSGFEALKIKPKKLWEQLDAEKRKVDSIVDSITTGIDIVGYDYSVHYQNKFLVDRFGDIRGMLCYREYMNRDTPCSDCPMRRAIENNTVERTELRGADGRDYEVLATPIKNPDGTMSAVEVVVDITERKQAEEALRESEEKYRTLFENANDAIFIADTDTHIILDANSQAEELIGRPREEIIGMHQSELHPSHQAEYYKEKFRDHVEKGSAFDLEAEVIKKDGSIVPVFISASVVTIHGKEMIQGLFRDISKEKMILDLTEEVAAMKLIEKAKGVLMDRQEITETEAMKLLQQESRRQRKKIKEIAQSIITSELVMS